MGPDGPIGCPILGGVTNPLTRKQTSASALRSPARLVLDDGDRSLALDLVKDQATEVGEPPYGRSRLTLHPLRASRPLATAP